MSSAVIDHVELGKSRVALQYTESAKFLSYISALLEAPAELEAVLQDVALQSDIDIAEGLQLDTIGDIVGISRYIPFSVLVAFFGFQSQPAARVFGEEGLSNVGARFRNELESEFDTSVLSDLEYRLLIRAKIVKNHSNGTGQDVLNGLSYLFNTPLVNVDDLGNMSFGVSVGRLLTFAEQALLGIDILSRPAGVKIEYTIMYDGLAYFGFDEYVGAGTFGEEGVLGVGGAFAEEF